MCLDAFIEQKAKPTTINSKVVQNFENYTLNTLDLTMTKILFFFLLAYCLCCNNNIATPSEKLERHRYDTVPPAVVCIKNCDDDGVFRIRAKLRH